MALEVLSRLLGVVAFGLIGWRISVVANLPPSFKDFVPWGLVLTVAGAVIGGGVGPYLTVRPLHKGLDRLNRLPVSALVAGTVGLMVGLVVAFLISIPLFRLLGWLGWGVPLIVSVSLGLLGLFLGVQREREMRSVLPRSAQVASMVSSQNGRILVDTSAIIDGRIADLGETGFLQSALVIPRFVLDELRHIADSSDSLRRNRGRRGLEVLGRLRKDTDVPIQVLDVDLQDGDEVDGKLVTLARDLKVPILTTDFNLNRVAELQGVQVLNVNELANALKPVVLPGEELTVNIIQEGREAGQGVGYLEDGTMVVVEGGRRYLNTLHEVIVTRVLQTAAGRIIFAHPKGG